jgi:hypothetical protein
MMSFRPYFLKQPGAGFLWISTKFLATYWKTICTNIFLNYCEPFRTIAAVEE